MTKLFKYEMKSMKWHNTGEKKNENEKMILIESNEYIYNHWQHIQCPNVCKTDW